MLCEVRIQRLQEIPIDGCRLIYCPFKILRCVLLPASSNNLSVVRVRSDKLSHTAGSSYGNENVSMAISLSDLIAQKDALERQIREAQSQVKAEAVKQVHQLMAEHGLTAADLVVATSKKNGVKQGSKVAPKYRDPISGATWTGRGLKPKWLAQALQGGKALADFAI